MLPVSPTSIPHLSSIHVHTCPSRPPIPKTHTAWITTENQFPTLVDGDCVYAIVVNVVGILASLLLSSSSSSSSRLILHIFRVLLPLPLRWYKVTALRKNSCYCYCYIFVLLPLLLLVFSIHNRTNIITNTTSKTKSIVIIIRGTMSFVVQCFVIRGFLFCLL